MQHHCLKKEKEYGKVVIGVTGGKVHKKLIAGYKS